MKQDDGSFEVKVGKGTITFRWFISVAFLANLLVAYFDYQNKSEMKTILTELRFQVVQNGKDQGEFKEALRDVRDDLEDFKDKFSIGGQYYNSHIKSAQ